MSVSPREETVTYRFGDFRLSPAERQLWRGETRVDLSARYFDALVLLVQEHGQLVEKDRFFADVWGDVVVSDSALTQCVKDIRSRLGDDASSPRYVETVPRYGYRFIAPVEAVAGTDTAPPEVAVAPASIAAEIVPLAAPNAQPRAKAPSKQAERVPLSTAALWGTAGALGGGVAGMLGGLLYGSALAYGPNAGLGTASVLVVLLALNVLVGLVGGAGVSFGMAAVGWAMSRSLRWSVAGAALGGLLVGGVTKLLGLDAFNLLFGRAPAGITGGLEGAALGTAISLGARLGGTRLGQTKTVARWWPVVGAGVVGGITGALIPAVGGHLMGGSLDLLARSFTGSRLHLDALGGLFGEVSFGRTAQVVLGSVEGLLFGSCVAGALVLSRRVLLSRVVDYDRSPVRPRQAPRGGFEPPTP